MERIQIKDEQDNEYSFVVSTNVYQILIALHEPPYTRKELNQAVRQDNEEAEAIRAKYYD